MNKTDDKSARIFCVVFNDGGKQWWWSKWLRPGFSHTFVLMQLDEDTVIGIDPILHGCNILRWKGKLIDVARCYADYEAHTVLEVVVLPEPRQLFQLESHCVGVVKRIMGIESGLTLTPYGLFKLMVSEYGATLIKPF